VKWRQDEVRPTFQNFEDLVALYKLRLATFPYRLGECEIFQYLSEDFVQ
jgi:hypothetical protein